jgi:hypothetical protein
MLRLQLPLKSCGDDIDPLRRALVCGLFPNSAKLQPDGGTYKVLHPPCTTAECRWLLRAGAGVERVCPQPLQSQRWESVQLHT